MSKDRRGQTRPENAAILAQIDDIRQQQERLRDTCVLGDTPRDGYLILRSQLEQQISDKKRELGGADYSLEAILARVDQVWTRLREGTRRQQKQALSILVSKISVTLTGEIAGIDPAPYAEPLFEDIVALLGDNKCPQRTFNAAVIATLRQHYPDRFPV